MTVPYVAVEQFFSKMNIPAPVGSTITRTINSLMRVGFLKPLKIGGAGKGDLSKYELTHDWRIWRKGDPPVYSKAGLSNVKGFCFPGSGEFCKAQKLKKGRERA